MVLSHSADISTLSESHKVLQHGWTKTKKLRTRTRASLDKRQKREEARDRPLSFCQNAIRFAISASAQKQS